MKLPQTVPIATGLRSTALSYSNALSTDAVINPDHTQNGQEDRRLRSDLPHLTSRGTRGSYSTVFEARSEQFLWLTLCLENQSLKEGFPKK